MTCRTLVLSLIALSGCDISVVFEDGDCPPWEECPDEPTPTGTETWTDPDCDPSQGVNCTPHTETGTSPYTDQCPCGVWEDGSCVPCDTQTGTEPTEPCVTEDGQVCDCTDPELDPDGDGLPNAHDDDDDGDGIEDAIDDDCPCLPDVDWDCGYTETGTDPTEMYCEYEPHGQCNCNGQYDDFDLDGDGVPDTADDDDDGDGWEDGGDALPCDANEA